MNIFFRAMGIIAFFPLLISSSTPHVANKTGGKGVLMVYAGNLKSPQTNFDIGIHFEMDPAIGIRYEVVYEKPNKVLSHMAIFYKFSHPNHKTYYNFLTHKSYENNSSGGSGGDPGVVVVGKEMMDKYACTHLRYLNEDKDLISRDDYWMSQKLPGFQEIIKVLNQLNSGAGSLLINGTVFNWGGLVKYKHYEEDKQKGLKMNVVINLIEANPAMDFPAKDFEVPGK